MIAQLESLIETLIQEIEKAISRADLDAVDTYTAALQRAVSTHEVLIHG